MGRPSPTLIFYIMRTNLTQYDEIPQAMVAYLRHYGPHFNKRLFEFAISHMTMMENGREVKLRPYTKEEYKSILAKYGITLKNDQLYDGQYVACMCRADFIGSSIPDEAHLAKYVKDVIDDVDGYDGIVFNRWYADMCYTGIAIDWEDMLG